MSRALWLAHVFEGLSRAQLTARLDVTRSTSKAIVETLSEAGLLMEAPQPAGVGRGRPSPRVAFSPTAPAVLAIEVAVSHVAVATVGLGSTSMEGAREPLPSSPTPAQAVDVIGGLARDCLRKERRPVVAAGVSFYGAVGDPDGFVLRSPGLGWRNVALGKLIEAELGHQFPVSVGNDADLAALAEARRMGGLEPADLVYLIAELGLGAGVVIGGSLLRGVNGAFGEVGHTVVNPAGRRCPCGRIGCWETEVDGVALLRHAGRPASQNLSRSVAELVADGQSGNPRVLAGLAEYRRWLAIGLTNVINIFDPPRIVLGGVLAQILPVIGEQLALDVTAASLVQRATPLSISAAVLRPNSALIGAADLAFTDVLADPVRWNEPR